MFEIIFPTYKFKHFYYFIFVIFYKGYDHYLLSNKNGV